MIEFNWIKAKQIILLLSATAAMASCTKGTSRTEAEPLTPPIGKIPGPSCDEGIPSASPVIDGNLTVEVGQKTNINLKDATDVYWIVFPPNGGERRVDTNPLEEIFTQAGDIVVSAYGKNYCGEHYEKDFKIKIIPAMQNLSVLVNADAQTTNVPTVRLQLKAENALEMYVTNDSSCQGGGQWQAYQPELDWSLASEGINSSVYVLYKNEARISDCVTDGILFDQTAPEVQFLQTPPAQTTSGTAEFKFGAYDLLSGVRVFQCAFQDEAFQTCPLEMSFHLEATGTYKMKIRAVDMANNRSAEKEFVWVYSTSNPNPPNPDPGPGPNPPVPPNPPNPDPGPNPPVPPNPNPPVPPTPNPPNPPNPEPPQPPQPLPPTVTITLGPEPVSSSWEARFEFIGQSHVAGGLKYLCQLDEAAKTPCQSPQIYSNLGRGEHSFAVIAVDAQGQQSARATYDWSIMTFPVHYDDEFSIDRSADRVDLLLVNDNSPSMAEEQKKMAKRFMHFISTLSGLDWQMAMITTDVSGKGKAWQNGRFLKFKGTNSFSINPITPMLEKVFGDTVKRSEWGSDDEQGIKAIRESLTRQENKSFFREQSHLATIIISDEDEKSNGTNLKPDNRPENLVRFIADNFGSERSYSNHSIIYQKPTAGCPQVGSVSVGKTYARLSEMTKGTVGDICAVDYSTTLQQIGNDIRQRTFTRKLNCLPLKETLQISYSPAPSQPIQEALEGEFLKLKPYPAKGTKVKVSYNCQ